MGKPKLIFHYMNIINPAELSYVFNGTTPQTFVLSLKHANSEDQSWIQESVVFCASS